LLLAGLGAGAAHHAGAGGAGVARAAARSNSDRRAEDEDSQQVSRSHRPLLHGDVTSPPGDVRSRRASQPKNSTTAQIRYAVPTTAHMITPPMAWSLIDRYAGYHVCDDSVSPAPSAEQTPVVKKRPTI